MTVATPTAPPGYPHLRPGAMQRDIRPPSIYLSNTPAAATSSTVTTGGMPSGTTQHYMPGLDFVLSPSVISPSLLNADLGGLEPFVDYGPSSPAHSLVCANDAMHAEVMPTAGADAAAQPLHHMHDDRATSTETDLDLNFDTVSPMTPTTSGVSALDNIFPTTNPPTNTPTSTNSTNTNRTVTPLATLSPPTATTTAASTTSPTTPTSAPGAPGQQQQRGRKRRASKQHEETTEATDMQASTRSGEPKREETAVATTQPTTRSGRPKRACRRDVKVKREIDMDSLDNDMSPALPPRSESESPLPAFTPKVSARPPRGPKSRTKMQEKVRDELDAVIYSLFPIEALRLGREEFKAWRDNANMRDLTVDEQRRLSDIRRMLRARYFAERSRIRKIAESKESGKTLSSLRAENERLKKKVNAYEATQAKLRAQIKKLEEERAAMQQ
eukprot:m.40030 g.40030  ORF g.40030 m.40030 type:complete len:443 (-) comp5906_c0_seq1:337-1665(-)